MEQLEIFARLFRTAIEQTPRDSLPITLQKFPAGACGDATLLLGHYLKSQGLGDFEYVQGQRGEAEDRHSHAWLRQEDILIDITADQFSEIDAPVIVTNDTAWHDSFETEVPHQADFAIFDENTVATLGAAYSAIADSLQDPE